MMIEVKFKRHSKRISQIDDLTLEEKEEMLSLYTEMTVLLEQFFSAKKADPLLTANNIISFVSEELAVPKSALSGDLKKTDIVFARQLCMYLISMRTTLSLKRIGQMFNRDHTTVMHSKQVIN